MPTLPLTARTVAALRAPDGRPRIEYFDAETPGLSLRITSDGVKTWTLVYRHRNRKRRLTLGRYPDLGLEKARLRAQSERGRIADGADPAAEKQDERATYGDTVGALYDLFRRAHERRLKSWSELRRIYEHDVLPAWKNRRVQDIKRRDIRDLVEKKAETAPVMANRLQDRISRLFSFAVEREWIEANPAFRMRSVTPERSRDRVLSRTELKELWKALHETEARDERGRKLPRLSQTLNNAFLVHLLTAQRPGEVWRMRWENLNLETGWWLIPREDVKNDDPHRVPLTPLVIQILKRRWKERDDRYVFSNYRHTCIADRAKKAASYLCEGGGVSFDFHAHDLRRTAASYMAEAGVDRFHIAHVLNHRSVTHSSVTAVYDRYRYDKEKRAALEIWAQVLGAIVGLKPARVNVATAKRARGPRVYEFMLAGSSRELVAHDETAQKSLARTGLQRD